MPYRIAPYKVPPNFQAMADNAPAGSVGAPGGLLAPAPERPKERLGGLLGAASMIPGPTGDILGPLADAYMYASDPSSRTWGNFGLSALGLLPFVGGATVFHGSPHKFDAFDLSKIGTGEGAQVYGHGLYFADSPDVAREYTKLSKYRPTPEDLAEYYKPGKKINTDTILSYDQDTGLVRALREEFGRKFETTYNSMGARGIDVAPAIGKRPGLYTVDLPDEAIAKMLDWDSPIPEEQRKRISEAMIQKFGSGASSSEGYQTYRNLVWEFKNAGSKTPEADASEFLRQQGIPGIRYLDGGSRSAGQGTSNYVVFDDKLPRILKRE